MMLRPTLLAVLLLAIPALAGEDFAFVQISDVHVDPHLVRTGEPEPLRGGEAIAWICRQAVGPQTIVPPGITTPAPTFGIATGDLTEYGVIDDTWSLFERAFEALPYRLYVLPGNHDNTWVAMFHIMRQRYGGVNYSFDMHGCHFACLCSASPQEPMPTIDAGTRTWLRRDLAGIPADTPVFIALHHPIYSTEFAPVEYDTFIDQLRDHNVVLVLYGHGHRVSHRNLDGIDGVMSGSTFGPHAGYAVISVQDDVLRVAYHYHSMPAEEGQSESGPKWQPVFEKSLRRKPPERLFRIVVPEEPCDDAWLAVELKPMAGAIDDLTDVRFWIDGEPTGTKAAGAAWLRQLAPGRHTLTVRATVGGAQDLRTATFAIRPSGVLALWRAEFDAAVKAGPVVVGDQLIVARTDGVVVALDRSSGKARWTFETGGEILGTPAVWEDMLVFGSGDGRVYALDGTGREVWKYEAGPPVYGWPLIDGRTVYIGDNGGRLHALNLSDGSERWTFSRADYAIESRPCIWDGDVVFGAWDGFLYALHAHSGELSFKVLGPKSSEGRAVRYYAPADCGPVAIGERLFACDRGYVLGCYDRAGKQGERVDQRVAGIAADASGRHLLARGFDGRVCKFDSTGSRLWERGIAAGRFPIPPTHRGDTVYICSNTGLLSALDAEDGQTRWQYQVTPGFYVMAPVAVDDRGTCYVAGMDGTVTALRAE